MSVNVVSGNDPATPVQTDDKREGYRARYQELNTLFESLITDNRYKAYFADGGDLNALQAMLKEKLDALNDAIEVTYDEKEIDKLMKALGALLEGNSSNMGLAARIEAYISLVNLKAKGLISDNDYATWLDKLNSENNIPKSIFDNLATIISLYEAELITKKDCKVLLGKILQGVTGDTLTALLDLARKRQDAIKYLKDFGEKYSEILDSLENLPLDEPGLIELIDEVNVIKADNEVERANEKAKRESTQSQGVRMSLAGLVFSKEVQAYNSNIEIDRQVKDENTRLNDVNFNRLQDENILNEQRESIQKNRQELQQQEALQAAKNAAQIEAERRAKNENI